MISFLAFDCLLAMRSPSRTFLAALQVEANASMPLFR